MAAVARVGVELDAKGAVSGLKNLDAQAKKTQDAFTRLRSAALAVGGAAAAIKAAKFVIVKTAELETQTRSLKVLTGSLQDAKKVIKDLQDFGAVTPFQSSELIETAKRLKAFGFETEQLVDVTKRLGDIAGATGADLSGIATAFGQIQAKGRLQGEELLQLQERGVDLQGTLRKEYGLTADEFQKALSKGQIGADAVNFALQKLTETGGKYANGAIAQSDTLNGKFSTVLDGIGRLATAIGTTLEPAIKFVLDLSIQAINEITTLLGKGAEARKFGLDQRQLDEIDRKARETAEQIGKARGYGFLDPRTALLQAQIGRDLLRQYGFESGQLQLPTEESVAAIERPELGVGTAGTGGAGAKAEKTIQDISKRTLELNNQLRAAQEAEQDRVAATLNLMLERQRISESTLGPLQRENELAQALFNFRQEIKTIDEAIAKQRAEDIAKAMEGFDAQLQYQDELSQAVTEQKNQYEELNTTFRTGIVDSILAAVEGTKSLKDSLLGVIKEMARLIVQQQLLNALSGFNLFGGGGGGVGFTSPDVLTSGIKFFANGGRPPVGRPSVVGESGPELFVPSTSGTIVPNNQLGGATNIVVNVDAKGSNAQGGDQQGKQLGQAIGAAIQAELIKQKRPGGLLS